MKSPTGLYLSTSVDVKYWLNWIWVHRRISKQKNILVLPAHIPKPSEDHIGGKGPQYTLKHSTQLRPSFSDYITRMSGLGKTKVCQLREVETVHTGDYSSPSRGKC